MNSEVKEISISIMHYELCYYCAVECYIDYRKDNTCINCGREIKSCSMCINMNNCIERDGCFIPYNI